MTSAPEVGDEVVGRWRTTSSGGFALGGLTGDYNGIHGSQALVVPEHGHVLGRLEEPAADRREAMPRHRSIEHPRAQGALEGPDPPAHRRRIHP